MAPREILFVDAAVADPATLLGGLRPGVEAIMLDAARPPARQIAEALAGRSGLAAVHIVAHGEPGRISFAAADWSADTLADAADCLPAIGRALGEGGGLRLWSCFAGADAAGEALVAQLTAATGAEVAAATGLVGAKALGGRWEMKSGLSHAGVPPPLTAAGVADYSGVLDAYIQIKSNGAPVMLDAGPFSLVARNDGKTEVIGRFAVLKGHPHNMLIKVAAVRSPYTVYAGPDGNLSDGQITIYDGSGKYSRAAALALLGADGAAIAVRSIASPPGSAPAAWVGDQPQSPAISRTMR